MQTDSNFLLLRVTVGNATLLAAGVCVGVSLHYDCGVFGCLHFSITLQTSGCCRTNTPFMKAAIAGIN